MSNTNAALITLGLFAMFFSGWLGGNYAAHCGAACGPFSDNAWRIQWEVLLTGIAAISGGYMAYRGATRPAQLEQIRKKLLFQKAVVDALDNFLTVTESEPSLIAELLKFRDTPKNGKKSELQLECEFADTAIKQLPTIPQNIYSKELDNIISSIRLSLQLHGHNRSTVPPKDTREQILQQIEKLRAITESQELT